MDHFDFYFVDLALKDPLLPQPALSVFAGQQYPDGPEGFSSLSSYLAITLAGVTAERCFVDEDGFVLPFNRDGSLWASSPFQVSPVKFLGARGSAQQRQVKQDDAHDRLDRGRTCKRGGTPTQA